MPMDAETRGAVPCVGLGDAFPDMKVQTTHGSMRLPKDLAGKWFVLFSHPADFTPVCTTEFVAFAKRADEFKKANCQLIGMSIDQVFSHIKWVQWIRDNLDVKIPFPIIADDMGALARQLGMIHACKGTNTVRCVYVVDATGTVRLVLQYPQEVGRNIDEVLRALRALQTSDREGGALPANWPDNELVGDHLIIPPAGDEKTADRRPKQYECFDWWFCHRAIGSDGKSSGGSRKKTARKSSKKKSTRR
jgi:peroxiredoxin (alkyl hydroperoxide reductase subunit C)